VGREDIFKPTTWNVTLNQNSNKNGVTAIFATSKILVVKSTMFLQRNILKYTWTSLHGKTHNQIDHILIDRRWLSILDVRGFRRADCDTDHYLVVAKVWERLAVSKQAAQKFEGERFNLRKLRFPALENLSDSADIHRTWENIKDNIKTSPKKSLSLQKLKQHKPWIDAEYLCFLHQMTQAKMQWIHNLSQSNVENLNIVRCEASRHFRNKKKEYLKAKFEELENNNKIKIIWTGIGASMSLSRVTSLELI